MVSPDDEVTAPSNDGGSSDPAVGDLIGDLFNDNAPAVADSVAGRASTSNRQYKPKGLFLGTRRDTGDVIDIAPQVLARHGAMLGSTGSGKTAVSYTHLTLPTISCV